MANTTTVQMDRDTRERLKRFRDEASRGRTYDEAFHHLLDIAIMEGYWCGETDGEGIRAGASSAITELRTKYNETDRRLDDIESRQETIIRGMKEIERKLPAEPGADGG